MVEIIQIIAAVMAVPLTIGGSIIVWRLNKLIHRATRILDMAALHGDMTDRKTDITRIAIASLEGVAAGAAEQARNAALAAETRLGRKMELEIGEGVKRLLEGGSAQVEMHGPRQWRMNEVT